ncbi:MAG: hypothetical protein IKT03_07885 [Muribaculaceae bacterium]|nr:hypothetical protein [Muribaculaceae bacterium]
MKKIIILALLVCGVMSISARDNKDGEIDAIMADARLKFTQGSNDVFLPDNNAEWRNGMYDCSVEYCYDEKDQPDGMIFHLNCFDEEQFDKQSYKVKMVSGKPILVNPAGGTVQHLVAGRWDMLVFRNASGAVLDVALSKKERYDDESVADLRDMINGVYAGTGKNAGDTVAFGAIYGYDKGRLPGADYQLEYRKIDDGSPVLLDKLLVAYFPERMKRVRMPEISKKVDENGVTHYYGDGKEISQREYENLASMPCGYKGHGSLHGPLLWWVKPNGNDLNAELYEPFQEELDAFYSNFRDEKFTLKWVRSPYKDNNNRWAVLSMRPVTRGMLALFDKEAMKLMLNYLNARKNPTDIEKLNKSLINTIVNGTAVVNKAAKNSTKKSTKSTRKSRRK